MLQIIAKTDEKTAPLFFLHLASLCNDPGAVVVQKVSEGKGDFGYNARFDRYENLLESGVIDPAKVTRLALENAASVAGTILLTECVVVDSPEDNKKEADPMMGGMY